MCAIFYLHQTGMCTWDHMHQIGKTDFDISEPSENALPVVAVIVQMF